MLEELNIILAGVGGQGIVLASSMLATAAVMAGLNIRGSEVLGLSQRGGAVVSHIRIGSKVYGPTVPDGKGDILVGLELSEALRNVTLLSREGLIIVNTKPIVPHTVTIGRSKYASQEEIIKKLKEYARVVAMDADRLAQKAGSTISINAVMLGALAGSGKLPMDKETILKAMEVLLPKQAGPVNRRAFALGYEETLELLRN